MRKGLIITLPRYDDTTEYLSQFSRQIEEEADDKGIKLKGLKDEKVTREGLEEVITKLDYKMIVFNGHGSSNAIEGYKEEIVKVGINDDLLRERIVYARSCHVAKELGKECTKDTRYGCFIGYDRPFQFYVDIRCTTNPLRDNTAKLFLEPSNLVPISIIKGNSTSNANENSKRQLLKNIKKILRNLDSESFKIAEALWNNYEGQVLLGNPDVNL